MLEALGAAVEQDEIEGRIAALRIEHRDLDAAIESLVRDAVPDQLRIARLKKRKLRLKDEVGALESMMLPDITA